VQISENQRLAHEGFPFFFAGMDNPAEPFDPRWKAWVEQHEHEDVAALALRFSGKPGLPLRFLLQQVKGRQIARQKLPSWYACRDIQYPDALSLEQCSSEVTALYKSRFVKGLTIADLTGGLGIDSWAFSGSAQAVLYNEPDPERVNAARHNLQALGCTNVQLNCCTAEEALEHGLPTETDLVYLDPSRRSSGGRKVFLLEDLQPDVVRLKENILRTPCKLLIKLSPMFDLQEGIKLLPETTRVDILSWRGDCRELLFHLDGKMGEQVPDPRVVCADLESDLPDFEFHFSEAFESTASTGEPEKWLYEPHAAVRKAGPWSLLCKKFGIDTLHPNTHLFTSDRIVTDFPGRRFRILDILPYRTAEILERVAGNPARMVFYNFPQPAKKVIAQLPIPSGEPRWLFFITGQDNHPSVLLTERET
jgi:hypothetical protein